MADSIKVNHLEGDTIKKIYIFIGNRPINKAAPWNLEDGTPIFTPAELKKIKDESLPIQPVNGYNHGDDTIITIKNKIIKYTELRISSKELYLFAIQKEIVDPSILYKQLTQNDTYNLTGIHLCQFLLNLVPNNCENVNVICPLPKKDNDSYDFEDMLAIEDIEWNAPLTYTLPIGQKMIIKKKSPFVANPYNCVIMDNIIRTKAFETVSTQNSNLLFEYRNLCNNNIYICLAEEVFKIRGYSR